MRASSTTPGSARSLDFLLARSPAQLLFRWRASRRLLVLAYHDVRDPDTFAEQVRYLAKALHPVTASDVLDALAGRRQLPRRAVLVTFDDGHRSVYEEAMPILRTHGVPAVAFVVAGLLDSAEPCWWVEVEELVRRGGTAPGVDASTGAACIRALRRLPNSRRVRAIEELRRAAAPGPPICAQQLRRSELPTLEAAGICVGNHTLTHPCLDQSTDAEVAAELAGAHDVLAGVLATPPRMFAYPNGNYDSRAAGVLARLGYEAAFVFDHRVGTWPPADRFRVSRVRVNSTTPSDRFRTIISGLHPALHHAAGRP